jgi:copper transport protein
MLHIGRRTLLVALVLGAALVLPQGAAAHALLIASDPAAGATLGTAPADVTLTFGEAPDPKLSTVRVLDSTGHNLAAGPVQPVAGKSDQLRVAVKPLPDGVYTVAWRTISSVDGHLAAGSFAFGVGVPPPSPAPGAGESGTSGPSGSAAAAIARWILYLGLIALFGATFLGFAIEPRAPRAVALMAGLGWVASLVGTLGVIGVQWFDAGADLGTLLGSSIGLGALERLGAAIVTGAFAAILVLRHSAGRWLFGAAAAATAVAMLVDVLNGHAANGPWWVLQVGEQWLHIVGVGVWIGGLAALLVAVWGMPSSEKGKAVRTFSTWAGLALGVVAVTGFLRALSEVQTIGALFGTGFGLVVIFKTLALGGLALLGAANRFINVPAAARTLRGLRRVGTLELGVATVVLAATGLLANLAPPSAAGGTQAPPAQPVVAVGSDFGTTVKLRLIVEPGTAGFNHFTASATDYDTGAPATTTGVALRFQLASQSGIGASMLKLASSGPGRFSATGGNLSLNGLWNVTATLSGPQGSVEVPLVVATRIPPERVEVNASPGTPTIYIVHLPDGGTVQVYLDPGTIGPNELHMTFFDKAGNETPIPSATVALTPASGASSIVAPRILEPGHFVTEVPLVGGAFTVDLIGQPPGGNPEQAHLSIEIKP